MIRIKRNEPKQRVASEAVHREAHAREMAKLKEASQRPKRTRSAQTGTLVGVRLQPDLLEFVDAYAKVHRVSSRAEVIRIALDFYERMDRVGTDDAD